MAYHRKRPATLLLARRQRDKEHTLMLYVAVPALCACVRDTYALQFEFEMPTPHPLLPRRRGARRRLASLGDTQPTFLALQSSFFEEQSVETRHRHRGDGVVALCTGGPNALFAPYLLDTDPAPPRGLIVIRGCSFVCHAVCVTTAPIRHQHNHAEASDRGDSMAA